MKVAFARTCIFMVSLNSLYYAKHMKIAIWAGAKQVAKSKHFAIQKFVKYFKMLYCNDTYGDEARKGLWAYWYMFKNNWKVHLGKPITAVIFYGLKKTMFPNGFIHDDLGDIAGVFGLAYAWDFTKIIRKWNYDELMKMSLENQDPDKYKWSNYNDWKHNWRVLAHKMAKNKNIEF